MSQFLDRLFTTLAKDEKFALPAANLHSFKDLGNGTAVVVVSHTTNAGQEKNYKALAKVLEGAATPIRGSFRRINSANENRVVSVGYVAVASRVEELTPERAKGMTALAKNVLMDDLDRSLWNVTESNGERFISRQTQENLNDVLSAVASVRVDVPNAKAIGQGNPSSRDYVAFVDTATASLQYGYVVQASENGLQVLPRDSDSLVSVAHDLIVSIAKAPDTKDNYLSRSLDKVEARLDDADKLKEYYRRVYQYDPAYLKLVEETIDKQASL